MVKFRLGDVARITPRKLKKYTPPGEKEFVDYSLNKIEKSRDPFTYTEEIVLAEKEGSALANLQEEKLGLRGVRYKGGLEKVGEVYGKEKGYLPQTRFDVSEEGVSRQIRDFELGVLTKKLSRANQAEQNILQGGKKKFIRKRELLKFPTKSSPSQTLFVLRQRAKIAKHGPQTVLTKAGKKVQQKAIGTKIKAIEFAKSQTLGLQKSLGEKGIFGKGESKSIPIKYLKSTSRFKKFMPAEVKAEMGLQEYTGLPANISAWTRADHIRYEQWKVRQKTGPRPKVVIPKHQKIYKERKYQLEKEFISKYKSAPGFARQVEIREGQRARPGDRIIYKRGIGIKRKKK